MSVISRRQAQVVDRSIVRVEPSSAGQRLAAVALLTAAICSVVALIIAGALLAYGLHHGDTIFAGTNVAGVQLGGKTVSEAEELLADRFDAYITQPIPLVAGDVRLTPTPAELGVELDARQTARKAYDFGRESNLWVDTRHWLDALSNGHRVAPVMTVDAETLSSYLDAHASGLVSAPVEPSFAAGSDGRIEINPGVPGIAVDVNETLARFQERIAHLSTDPVAIATVPVAPEVADDQYHAAFDRVQALAGQPLRLKLNGNMWEIGTRDLLAMLDIRSDADGLSVRIDESLLRRSIRTLEPQVFQPGIDASIRNDSGTFVTIPASPGSRLDIEMTLEATVAALEHGDTEVQLATLPVDANVTTEDVEEAKALAERLTAKPIKLTWDSGNAVLDPDRLASVVRFDVNAGRNPNVAVLLDESAMESHLSEVAREVKVDGQNAELRWIDGQVAVRTPEKVGRELDLKETVDQILSAMHGGTGTVAVVTKDLKPQITADMASGIQLPDKLATGQTFYGDSAPNRYHNVELATSRVNGAMVPPGAIFSFNQAVGEVTINSGYKTGYGIIATNGSISTVPSVGGGICQVATTLFHAAFRSGMPIEKRSWHLYWIPRYGQPPTGLKGLDATVDPDYDLDFLFKNATNNWIAIKSYTDGSNVHFEIWGTNPGWEVTVDQPVISNIRPATQQMYYENSNELPAGTSAWVEHAEDGFDARIRRVVKKDGQVIDEVTLVSTYEPARNVTLVGTG